jgi:glycosyltransferase involved in cell wall biosynthesis
MRILQIYELNPLESIGGVEGAVFQLSKELVKMGHEVTILTGAGKKRTAVSQNGVNIISFDLFNSMKHTYRSGSLTPLRQLLFLTTVLTKNLDLKYDIYHGHIYTSGIIANYLARKYNGIAVNTIHGSYYPVWERLTNPISAFFYRTVERQLAITLAKHSDLQLHVSTYFAEQVSAWGGDVKVIPNGVDLDVFHPEVIREFHHDLPVLLTARRLVKKNGLEYLIRAMEFLKNECDLLIIGDGPERARLELMAKKSKNIKFLGSVPHRDMPKYIACSEIVVIPSIIEASSLFMLEAMAMGKPVVASSVGGLPETLGDSGLLVPPMHPECLANAIRDLLSNNERRRLMGNKARIRVEEKYSWQKIARQIEGEYKYLWRRGHA